jgi:hypothetical protein
LEAKDYQCGRRRGKRATRMGKKGKGERVKGDE